MLKKILNSIANPILFYVDKFGNSVFRNYCFLQNNGCLYNKSISKQDIGRTLEYRFVLDKWLKRTYIWATVLSYFMFIHSKMNFLDLLFVEILWLLIVCIIRIVCSKKYNKFLESRFGKYELTNFHPPVLKEKVKYYRKIFIGRAVVICCLVGVLFIPMIFLKCAIKTNVEKKQKYLSAVKLAKVYSAIYPQNANICDSIAIAKYMLKDNQEALNYYKKSLMLSGKTFDPKKDIIRLGNLLFLQKSISNAQEAVDLFNEYATKKVTTLDDDTQLLWVKSMFKIENNIVDGISFDYDNLLSSVDKNDYKKYFYIKSDKAYILYLIGDYVEAVDVYDSLISDAQTRGGEYSDYLMTLYAERGFAKRQLGDYLGADEDFSDSQISRWELVKYEPKYEKQVFIIKQK